jgi:hypothetical protein
MQRAVLRIIVLLLLSSSTSAQEMSQAPPHVQEHMESMVGSSGGPAKFEVNKDTMRYEDSGDGTPWISEFTRSNQKAEIE